MATCAEARPGQAVSDAHTQLHDQVGGVAALARGPHAGGLPVASCARVCARSPLDRFPTPGETPQQAQQQTAFGTHAATGTPHTLRTARPGRSARKSRRARAVPRRPPTETCAPRPCSTGRRRAPLLDLPRQRVGGRPPDPALPLPALHAQLLPGTVAIGLRRKEVRARAGVRAPARPRLCDDGPGELALRARRASHAVTAGCAPAHRRHRATAHCVPRAPAPSIHRSEETRCRFCDEVLPDWRPALTPEELQPKPSVMSVRYKCVHTPRTARSGGRVARAHACSSAARLAWMNVVQQLGRLAARAQILCALLPSYWPGPLTARPSPAVSPPFVRQGRHAPHPVHARPRRPRLVPVDAAGDRHQGGVGVAGHIPLPLARHGRGDGAARPQGV